MRICTVSNTPHDPSSGSGYVVCGYAERLRMLGAQVHLLGPADFEPLRRWRRAIGYRQALGMALATWRANWDIIEFYGGEAWLAISLLRKRARRPLLVCHSNGIETHCADWLARADQGNPYQRRWFQPNPNRLYKKAFLGADAIVTVSQFDASYAIAQNYKRPDRILTIENPLPDSYLGLPLSPERGLVIGYCGAWLPIKGVERIASEVSGVLRRNPDWHLLLVGVGGDFKIDEHFPVDIARRIEAVSHVERLGELPLAYARMRILILPSLYESFGLVAAEGMASGCALVASPVGFAAALRGGEEALLVGNEDGALSNAIERLIGDDALRRRIAAAGHRRVQTLRWNEAASALFNAYSRWLSEHRQR